MKEIFDHRIYLSFDNGKTWEDTQLLKNWEYRYPECAKEDSCTIHTYDDARTFVLNSCCGGVVFFNDVELVNRINMGEEVWPPVKY